MTAYFSSDGTLKYSNRTQADIVNSAKSSSSSSNSAAASASSASSSSSFSNEMKKAALQASGRVSNDEKTAARANSPDYQRMAAYQARIEKIASHKPRTFDDEDTFTINMSAITNYTAAQEKYNVNKGSSLSSSSSSKSVIASASASASSHVYGQHSSSSTQNSSPTVAGYNKDILKTFI